MDAQCISNTTRVCPKALEKHFFSLTVADCCAVHHDFVLKAVARSYSLDEAARGTKEASRKCAAVDAESGTNFIQPLCLSSNLRQRHKVVEHMSETIVAVIICAVSGEHGGHKWFF